MGWFAQRVADMELRNDPGWLTRDDGVEVGPRSASGVRVNAMAALSLTTVWRCYDLLSSAVSQSPKDIIIKVGGKSFPEFGKPSWLIRPNPGDPTYTISDYFSQVTLSLLFDGNYFVSVFPHVFDPQTLTVIPPSRVDVRPGPVYDIKDEAGHVFTTLTPAEMLHGTWIRPAGALRGIGPLEALRRSIGSAVAAEEFGARFFGQGASLAFGVEIPGALTPTQRTELETSLKRKHAGLQNSHAIGVLTGGGKFVSGLAPTPEQAQMLATRQFSVEDLCRPFGVPPHMVGSQQPGAVSYASVNGTLLEFKQYAVLPLALRIEAQHNRLVQVPAGITAPDATAQFKFNLDGIARADLETRTTGYSTAILSGQMSPDEARVLEDRPPMGGNAGKLLMQQQMVPIDDLGATKLTEPLNTQPAPAGARSEPAVTFADGAIQVHVAPAPAPSVTFADGAIRSETPVTITQPDIQFEPHMEIRAPEPLRRTRFERDESGVITGEVEEFVHVTEPEARTPEPLKRIRIERENGVIVAEVEEYA